MSKPVISYHEDGKYNSLYKGHIREIGSEIEWIRSTFNSVLFALDFDEEVKLLKKEGCRPDGELEPITDEHASLAHMNGIEKKYQKQLISDLNGSHFFNGIANVAQRDDIYDQNRNYRFSVFGSELETQKLEIVIRKNHSNHCSFFAGGKYGLSIEITIAQSDWDEVHNMVNSGKKIWLSVNITDPDFYAEWSPEVNEGRLIKFYDRPLFEKDQPDLPDHMKRSGIMNLEFSLMERKPLQSCKGSDINTTTSENMEQVDLLLEKQQMLNDQLIKLIDAMSAFSKRIVQVFIYAAVTILFLIIVLLMN